MLLGESPSLSGERQPDELSITLVNHASGKIRFPSPLLNASGAFNPTLFNEMFSLSSVLGGIVTKTTTIEPTSGNPQHRTAELPGVGMLNSIGLQNPGLAYFLANEAPLFKSYGLPLILSISACSSAEFAAMAEAVLNHPNGAQVDALELNLSCPNISKGGIHFGSSPELVKEAVSAVVSVFSKPVFAKLTPNVDSIVKIGEAAVEGGSFGLTAINTVLGAAIDIRRKKPILARVSGGYSGPGIKPIAIHAVWELRRHFPETPIMGVGGILTTEDVLEFMMAGASLVQVGTACFRDPFVFPKMHRQLCKYLDQYRTEGITSLQDVIGIAHG